MSGKKLEYSYDPDGINEVIDESTKADAFIALRKVNWTPGAEYKLDLRKYYVKPDGEEFPTKGLSFFTPEGPHTLVETMAVYGFGHTDKIIEGIRCRDDFMTGLAQATISDKEEFMKKLESEYIKLEEAEPPIDAKQMLDQLL